MVTIYYRIYKLTPLWNDRQHYNAKEHTEIIDRHDFNGWSHGSDETLDRTLERSN